MALTGLAIHATAGWRELLLAAAAGALVLVVGTLPFSLGWVGGGDVKLFAACACTLAWSQIVPLLLYTALLGGAVALVALVMRRFGRATTKTVPFAVAMAGGVVWLALGSTLVPAIRIL